MPAVALLSWPLIAIGLFAALGPVRGLIWVTLLGYLFLPEAYGFDLPGFVYNKRAAIAISLLLAVLFFGRQKETLTTGDPLLKAILAVLTTVLFLAAVFTVLNNRFALIDGDFLRQALRPNDLLGMTMEMVLILTPFFLARRWLTTSRDQTSFLVALVALGLAYSLLVLFEIRMSPQLNRWVYGFFPHAWTQHIRGGGFRPLVFLNHGLELGFFLFMAVVAAFTLSRQMKERMRIGMALAGCWLMGVLLISHNLGAAMLAILFVPAVLILGKRIQIQIAALVAVIFLSYPVLRQAEILPVYSFTSAISNISEQRARSFEFRLANEDMLLERALEKPVFGWGPWARGQVFNQRGDMVSVPDGLWILTLGTRGWMGFLAFFGLLAVPLIFMGRAVRRKTLSPVTAGLAIMAAGNLIYMVPNSTLSPISAMMFGLLAGFAHSDAKRDEDAVTDKTPDRLVRPRYTRFDGPPAT